MKSQRVSRTLYKRGTAISCSVSHTCIQCVAAMGVVACMCRAWSLGTCWGEGKKSLAYMFTFAPLKQGWCLLCVLQAAGVEFIVC